MIKFLAYLLQLRDTHRTECAENLMSFFVIKFVDDNRKTHGKDEKRSRMKRVAFLSMEFEVEKSQWDENDYNAHFRFGFFFSDKNCLLFFS